MCMTISIEKSIQQEKDTTDTTKTGRRQPTYKINPLILNRWSPSDRRRIRPRDYNEPF